MAGNKAGIRTRAIICSLCFELMDKVSFSGSKARLQFRALNENFLLALVVPVGDGQNTDRSP